MGKLKWLSPLVFLLSAACTSQPPAPPAPPFEATVPVKDLMANVMDPTADQIWESVGTIMTKEGTFERAPQTNEEWLDVKAAAITLAEISNVLMLPQRSAGSDEWVKLAQATQAQSKRIIKAAEAKDRQAIFDIGAELYDSCVNCHKRFDPAIRDVK